MRKLIISVAAMAAMMLAGCQQEMLEPASETNVVSYSVEIPEVATKATVVDDGTNINDLVYAVYRTQQASLEDAIKANDLSLVYQRNPNDQTTFVEGKTVVRLELVNNQNYVILFWAQVSDAWVVGQDFDLTEVTYPTEMEANNSGLAAFAGVDFLEKGNTPGTKSVTLYRPFAQINVGTITDIKVGEDPVTEYTVELTNSAVRVNGAGASFNVLTQKAEGNDNLIFDPAEVPGGKLSVNNIDYTYAAMNYIFANGNVDVEFDLHTVSHGRVNEISVPAVPVEKNYRTNIVGNLLTSSTDYTVTLDNVWGEPAKEVVVVQNAAGLQDAINNAEVNTEIKIDSDIDLNDLANLLSPFSTKAADAYTAKLTIPAEASIVLNLNGKNLTYSSSVINEGMIHNYGSLTLKGEGNVVYTYTGEADGTFSKGNYAINNSGTLIVDGPTVSIVREGLEKNTKFSHAFYAVNTSGNFTLASGKVQNDYNVAVRQWIGSESAASTITMNGGEIYGLRGIWMQLPNNNASKAPIGKLNVNGGTLSAWDNAATYDSDNKLAVYSYSHGNQVKNVEINITGGTINGDIALTGGRGEAKVDVEKVTITGGTFNGLWGDVYSYAAEELVKEAITISGGEFSSLAPMAYLAEDATFKLNKDIVMTEGIKFDGVGTLDLNGKTVTGTDNSEKSFGLITNTGTLTVKNGTMVLEATVNREWNAYSSVLSNNPGGKLTVENATINHLGGTDMAYGIDNLTNGKGTYAETVVNNGAVIKSTYRAIRMFLNGVEATNELYVNDGAVVEGANKSIWMQDPSKNANTGKLVVNEDAQLKGNAYLTVTAGSTEWPVYVSIADSALQDESTVLTSNVPALYDVVLKDGFWTIESSFSFATFVEAVIAAEGNYDGHGQTIKIIPVSGRSDNTNGCLVPNRLQKYTNPEVYYAQYQRFAELENVNISNVNFVFVPSAITVEDAWNTAGATTTAENVNGELQFMNAGSVTLTNCTFDKVAVSPINAAMLTVNDCQFDGLNAYAIKDIKAKNVSIINTEFDNCNGGFWFNAAPASLIVTGNTFTTVGRRGAIQFSANGDYSNTTLNIASNKVVGEGAFLWQLNKTITGTQIKPVSENNEYTNLYVDGSVIPADIAKIGDKIYTSLSAAVEAVKDGETIILVADEVFTKDNYYNNGGWKDGLGYSGDKSFTIDLGGYTIKQDGSLNDYLIWIKNDGAKDNTITFKNGTMDAGTTAYCALATASSNAKKMTINLENINLINNISNGAVVKARGGSVLNVNAGTVITGKNSYTGIEAAGTNTVVNVYDGAEIYQNGTSSYVGAIAGASQNATLNIYGGKGKSARCGIIVMSTGATINVSGGEWTANNDGTVAGDNNAVLVSQNNRHESSWACKSVLNVTGGTFKGGYNCYGMGPGVEADDAQINIKGGNFNADPKTYVVDGYKAVESNGTWNIAVDPAAMIGTTEYATLQEAFNVGGDITLLRNVTISETATLEGGKTAVLDLNGKTILGTMHKNDGCVIKNNGTMEIKNGTISSTAANGGSAVQNYGTLKVENTTLNGANGTDGSWPSYPVNNYATMSLVNVNINGYQGAIACNAAGKTTLDNCNVVKNYFKTSSHVFYINHADAEVVVNSGSYAHNGFDGSLAYVNKGMITVNGGTFTAKDGGYGMAALSAGTIVVNGGTLPAFLNWGGKITDNR